MNSVIKIVVFLFVMNCSVAVLASELEGIWKLKEEPVWIEFTNTEDNKVATIKRNDNNQKAVGATFLKGLSEASDGAWNGQIYVQRFKEFKDAEILFPSHQEMAVKVKVGFMSRTVNWEKVSNLPID